MRSPEVSELPSPPEGKAGWPWSAETPPLPIPRPDRQAWPRISIVTPSFNQGRFIEETIRSVLLQGYPDLEYVVIDGGSTDETVRIVKKYESWIAHFTSERDDGQSHALNKGFAIASGQVLGWLNSDDVLTQGALAEVGEWFAKNPGSMVLAGSSEIRTSDGREVRWHIGTISPSLGELYQYARGKYLAQPSVFFRREALNLVGPVRQDLHYAMDLDLWLRLAARCKFDTTASRLSWMRHHDDAKTYSSNVAVLREVENVLKPYRDAVPAGIRNSCRRALGKQLSDAWSREGLRAYLAGNRKLAWYAAFAALAEAHTAFAKRAWLGLILRLILPSPLHSMVTKRP